MGARVLFSRQQAGVEPLGPENTLGFVTASKDETDIDSESGERFAVAGWGTLDLTAGWLANEWLELRAGVFNLGDKAYWRWLDVANLEADNPLIPVLSRPGRNYSITARIAF